VPSVEFKAFYNSASWALTRKAVLARDKHLCQTCLQKGILTPASTVHHKVPIEDAPEKALDMDNLETICRACHNLVHPEKSFGYKDLRKRIIVILGYPGAGKTTYVKQRMGDYDIILDVDILTAAITQREVHDRTGSGEHAFWMASDMVSRVIRDVRAKGYVFDTLWIIRTRLSDEEYHALRAARARLYWIDASREVCMERLRAQGREDAAEAFDKCNEFMRRYGAKISRIPPSP
jgi:5-methylcytosine-specific restriction protein A